MKLKRVISAVLAVSMAVSMMPATAVTAFATDAEKSVVTQTVEGEESENSVKTTAVTVSSFQTGCLKDAVEAAAKKANVAVKDITSLAISGGTLNETDFEYLSSVTVDGNGNATYNSNADLMSLVALDLTDASCENNKIPDHAFQNNTKIQTVILPNDLEEIGRSAFNCVNKDGDLSYVGTREGKESNTIAFPKNVKKIGQSAFWCDSNLTGKLELPENLKVLGTNAFDSTKVTGEITINGNVEFEKAANGNEHNGTFRETNITAITFEEGIKTIPVGFARNCSELESVTIPESVSEIKAYAFFKAGKVTNFIVPRADVTVHYGALHDENQRQYNIYFKSAQERVDPSNNYNKWGEKAIVLNTDGGNVNTEKSAYGLFVPEKDGYTFDGWSYTANGETKMVENENDVVAGKTYTAKWSAKTYKVTFVDENGEALGDAYPEQDLTYPKTKAEKPADPEKEGYTFTGWYTADGKKFDFNKDVTGDVVLHPEWVADHELTVKDGTISAKLDDTDLTNDEVALKKDGNTVTATIPEGAIVTVTFDDSVLKDSGSVFDQWKITSDEKLLVPDTDDITVNVKDTAIKFVMPKGGVKIEAMTRDATIEDDSSEALGIAAAVVTGAVGTAVLTYQGYMLGTELYLNYLLPAGAAIPTNRAQLAVLLWQDAGKPEPAAPVALDAADDVKALTWAVETGLMDSTNKNGEALAADASVSRIEVIKTWKKSQELKKN